jgi:hypothetical protein
VSCQRMGLNASTRQSLFSESKALPSRTRLSSRLELYTNASGPKIRELLFPINSLKSLNNETANHTES